MDKIELMQWINYALAIIAVVVMIVGAWNIQDPQIGFAVGVILGAIALTGVANNLARLKMARQMQRVIPGIG